MTDPFETLEPEKDLLAQVTAQKLVLNALLISLIEKKLLSKHEVETLLESTVASLDQHATPFLEIVSSYVREFRTGIGE